MKQEILSILQKMPRPLSVAKLTVMLNILNHQSQEEMLADLEELKTNNIIQKNDNNEFYLLREHKSLLIGIIQITTKGSGFIKLKNNDSEKEYRVNPNSTNGALNNDEVLFSLLSPTSYEAIVVSVLKRNTTSLVGTCVVDEKTKEKSLIIQNSKMQQYKVKILNPDQAIENNIVVAKINSFQDKTFSVTIKEILGNLNDPGVDILGVIHELGIKENFDPETLLMAHKISQTVTEQEKVNRIDYRNDTLVTIDGKDAKDFDDAICVYPLDNGNYRLIVAIADVSHYVKPGTFLDNEAFERGTSVYLADRVIPMLPTQLSNGICSLNEQVERLCMVCDMEIDIKGKTVKKTINQGLMKSVRRMNYDEVNDAYHDKNPEFTKTHPQVWKMLQDAKTLYQILNKAKQEVGVIDFNIEEAKVILDNNGQVSEIKLRSRDISEKLIESFMIRANEAVAETIFEKNLPFIYRIHEAPRAKKIQQLTTLLRLMGVQTTHQLTNLHSKDLQILLNSLKDRPGFQVLSQLMLRSMEKAKYTNKNVGHFGLASDCYTHFTSPIRRYPDLIVHRLLREYLIVGNTSTKTLTRNKNMTALAAEQSSIMEIKAMECERVVEQMKKAEYMTKFIGENFVGHISNLTGFGIFVELPNTIEGLIHISDLKDDYYIFNDKTMMLYGERRRKQFRLGQEIAITVKSANKVSRTIDFIIAPSDTTEDINQKKRFYENGRGVRNFDRRKRKWNAKKF